MMTYWLIMKANHWNKRPKLGNSGAAKCATSASARSQETWLCCYDPPHQNWQQKLNLFVQFFCSPLFTKVVPFGELVIHSKRKLNSDSSLPYSTTASHYSCCVATWRFSDLKNARAWSLDLWNLQHKEESLAIPGSISARTHSKSVTTGRDRDRRFQRHRVIAFISPELMAAQKGFFCGACASTFFNQWGRNVSVDPTWF